ncbi:MAG TPA: hypothetical protein DCF63_20045 [Planctomycetaceae bacterium]|nr:hypothetical protein [Planctomycetaceae bacterium]
MKDFADQEKSVAGVQKPAAQPQDLVIGAASTTKCPVCGSCSGTILFKLPTIPVHVGKRYRDQPSALAAPWGTLELVFCHACGHVYNRSFRPELLNYEPGYEVSLASSPVFVHFMQSLAERLISRFDLHAKKILEIGAGNGWFLEMLCGRGGNQGVGVDPSIERENERTLGNGSVRLLRSRFDEQLINSRQLEMPDFVCSLSVFEHLESPGQMLAVLKRWLGANKTMIYCEVFNAMAALRRHETWSVMYEQCHYFSPESLKALFRNNGFQVLASDTCYQQDQYLYVEAANSVVSKTNDQSLCGSTRLPLPEDVRDFDMYYKSAVEQWRFRLAEFAAQKRRVAFWGSAGKGVNFLNLLPTVPIIQYVAEVNPKRHGCFIPGTGQQIVPPSFLAQYRPDIIIVSNAIYKSEIAQQAADMGLECQFYVA